MRLEEELKNYDLQLINMLKRVKTMLDMSKESLQNSDKSKALNIIEMDDYINHLDEDINNHASIMLSLLQPVAKDLRQIIAGIKISTDIERIGDYAKTVGRFVIRSEGISEDIAVYTDAIIDLLIQQLDDTILCLHTLDINLAYEIPLKDQKVDEVFVNAINYIEKKIHEEATLEDFHYPIRLVSTFRSLERAGDHIKNICEAIIYRIKGQHIDFG
ncbi:MAG: phosphate signaling complex protein PhoU [Erysipelothrix sp.]|jgi:phosphate transport system protein|nr:phosphate signaling complex protein PhoU [Erysipelothrix sp.]